MSINNLGHMTKMAAMPIYMQKAVKMLWKGRTSGNGQMNKIFMILKTKLTSGIILIRRWGNAHVYEHYKFIGINLRSQVSVYRTIGPLVCISARLALNVHHFYMVLKSHV